MAEIRNKFFRTGQYSKVDIKPGKIVFEKSKVIGTPVKVMRTGQTEPDPGWFVADVYFRNAKKKTNRVLVKVQKPDQSAPDKGLQKIVSLQQLAAINPEIKLLIDFKGSGRGNLL